MDGITDFIPRSFDMVKGKMEILEDKSSHPQRLPTIPSGSMVSLTALSCLFVASLIHSNQVKVIKGKFLTEKECQTAFAAYALNIDARWFDVVFTNAGEMHEIIGASKSYRFGMNGVIFRTVTMNTTEGKYRVVVYRGEGVKPPVKKSKQCHEEIKIDDNGLQTSNMPPNFSITTTTRLGSQATFDYQHGST
jgi:hypothetical protein